jgi:hypothetical protein
MVGGPGANQAVYDINITGTRTAFFTAVVGRAILGTATNAVLDFDTNGATRMSIDTEGFVHNYNSVTAGVTVPPNGGAWVVIATLQAGNYVGATLNLTGAENGNVNVTYSKYPAVYSASNGWLLGAEYAKVAGGNSAGGVIIRINGNNVEAQSASGFVPQAFIHIDYVRS